MTVNPTQDTEVTVVLNAGPQTLVSELGRTVSLGTSMSAELAMSRPTSVVREYERLHELVDAFVAEHGLVLRDPKEGSIRIEVTAYCEAGPAELSPSGGA